MAPRPWRLIGLCIVASAAAGACHAGSLRVCDHPAELGVAEKDTLFRFGGIVKAELDRSGQGVALIARSGLDLGRFGVRYSHAGVSLKASPNTPWSVRQLYYACDEGKPRIYDQGMSGFVLGTIDPAIGYVSVVLLPTAEAADVEQAALDKHAALQMLATTYSANAYPFSTRYQNCNQWVIELLAAAIGRVDRDDGADEVDEPSRSRAQAQRWLMDHGYTPTSFDVGWRVLMWAGAFIPWLHGDDHPAEDIVAKRYRVSMPASIEAFVHTTMPGATRIEFCHTASRVVIRRGWEAIADGCVPAADDTVIALD